MGLGIYEDMRPRDASRLMVACVAIKTLVVLLTSMEAGRDNNERRRSSNIDSTR